MNKEFTEWLESNRLSLEAFAKISGYSATYLSKIKCSEKPMTKKVIQAMRDFERTEFIRLGIIKDYEKT